MGSLRFSEGRCLSRSFMINCAPRSQDPSTFNQLNTQELLHRYWLVTPQLFPQLNLKRAFLYNNMTTLPTPYATGGRVDVRTKLLNPDTCVALFKCSEPMMRYLWKQIYDAEEKQIDWKHQLAGNDSHSFKLEDPENKIIYDLFIDSLHGPNADPMHMDVFDGEITKAYRKIFRSDGVGHNLQPTLESLWVNYQHKYEFNPLHTHQGIYSFVIWMDIPYDCKEEQQLPIARSSLNEYIGNFVFTYPTGNSIGTEVIDMHPEMNGWCVFFPSDLAHQVYPFYTSDERRVSIAGNIMFEESTGAEIPNQSPNT